MVTSLRPQTATLYIRYFVTLLRISACHCIAKNLSGVGRLADSPVSMTKGSAVRSRQLWPSSKHESKASIDPQHSSQAYILHRLLVTQLRHRDSVGSRPMFGAKALGSKSFEAQALCRSEPISGCASRKIALQKQSLPVKHRKKHFRNQILLSESHQQCSRRKQHVCFSTAGSVPYQGRQDVSSLKKICKIRKD